MCLKHSQIILSVVWTHLFFLHISYRISHSPHKLTIRQICGSSKSISSSTSSSAGMLPMPDIYDLSSLLHATSVIAQQVPQATFVCFFIDIYIQYLFVTGIYLKINQPCLQVNRVDLFYTIYIVSNSLEGRTTHCSNFLLALWARQCESEANFMRTSCVIGEFRHCNIVAVANFEPVVL